MSILSWFYSAKEQVVALQKTAQKRAYLDSTLVNQQQNVETDASA